MKHFINLKDIPSADLKKSSLMQRIENKKEKIISP